MKSLHKILKISAKESFEVLRKNGPYYCASLQKNIRITRLFWEHINFEKPRSMEEQTERLAFFPLIPKIIEKGVWVETRKNRYKILYIEEEVYFSIIVEETSVEVLLLSCFVEYEHKKNALSYPFGNSGVKPSEHLSCLHSKPNPFLCQFYQNSMKKNAFPSIVPSQKFSEIELSMLDFWKKNDVFQKSVDSRPADNEYVFFDGPPFATGTPHYGHILAGAIKDAIPRYMTMKGFRVNRKWGWDCHGVPVEFDVEKRFNIGGKPGIEKMGVANFNETCRSIVLEYTDAWEKTVERMGRFVDFKNDYKTMDPDFMESVWSVFAELWNKGLIYEGEKVIAYSPKLGSPLSNFEAGQNYKQIKDKTLVVKFELEDESKGEKSFAPTYILAWTTTPWTLPSNLGLCVHPNLEYVKVQKEEEIFIVAKNLSEKLFGENAEIIETISGKDLIGKKYKPLFPYYENHQNAFQILADDFVSDSDGTGIVHLAPNFGEEDARVCQKNGISFLEQPIDENGYFTEKTPELAGKYFRPDETVEGSKENNANDEVIKMLKEKNLVFKQDQYDHEYPFCWRTDCALMYRGIKTWFVNVQKIKNLMLEQNQEINWNPDHLKDGRFGKILENAPDWAISRNRYWGAPIPVWRCESCGHTEVISTREELLAKTGKEVNDLHKHFVDELSWECPKCAKNTCSHDEFSPYFEEIAELMETVTAENFGKPGKHFLVGNLPQEAIDAMEFSDTKVHLSEFVYAKIRNWIETKNGHPEVHMSDFFLLPFLLQNPNIILDDKKHQYRYLLVEAFSHKFVIVLEERDEKTQIVTFFYEERPRKDQNIIYKKRDLGGRAMIPPCTLSNLRKDLNRLAARFSSHQVSMYTDVIKLVEESQYFGDPSNLKNPENPKMKRIPEVLDCWFESGAMPYASRGIHFQKDRHSGLDPESSDKKPIIFFDFDGVIWNSSERLFESLQKVAEEQGKIFTREDFAELWFGNFWEQYFAKGYTEKDRDRMFELAGTTKFVPFVFAGTKEFLEKISPHFDCRIISSNKSERIGEYLKKNDLHHYFSEILGCDTLGNKQEKFEKFFAHYNKEVFFITDSAGDLREAKPFSQIKSVGVSWGVHSKDILLPENPAFVAENFGELEAFLLPKETEIFFVRHGESLKNFPVEMESCSLESAKKYPLTEKGTADAEKEAQKYQNFFDVIVTSPFLRAKQTAEIFAKTSPNAVFLQDMRLKDIDVGEFDDKPLSESNQYRNEVMQNDIYMSFGGGESLQEVQERMFDVYLDVEKKYPGKKILLVSHGCPLEALYDEICILPLVYWAEGLEHAKVFNTSFLKAKGTGLVYREEDFEKLKKKNSLPTQEKSMQADFIAEGLDQTRGWFYTLHVLGCALTGKNIFKNVITNGIVLAEDGQKMSKSKKNYPDPNLIFEKYGADAMRFYMLSSPVVRAENFRFAEKGVEEILKTILIPLQNVYSFFAMYANIDGFHPVETRLIASLPQPKTDLDRWILGEYEKMRAEFTEKFEAYRLDEALRGIPEFIDSLTNWYIRRSRDRFWESGMNEEKKSGYETLYFVLKNLAKILAPIMPFYAEFLWKNLTENSKLDVNSVHLQNLAEPATEFLDENLSEKTKILRDLITLSASIRARKKLKRRQPLAKMSFALSSKINFSAEDLNLLQEEANVKTLEILENIDGLAKQIIKADARQIGKKFGKKTQEIINAGKSGMFDTPETVGAKNLSPLQHGQILVCGEILESTEYEMAFECAQGLEGEGNQNAVVLLDTEISEELFLEGISREIIRTIQEGRKTAQFNISDRISVQWFSESENIKKAYEKFGQEIDAQTLTVKREFSVGAENLSPDFTEMEEGKFVFTVRVV